MANGGMPLRTMRIVICSPEDVGAERDAARRAVYEASRILAFAGRDVRLEPICWETHARPGLHEQGPQGGVDEALNIKDADVVVVIFWRRLGLGTKHELEVARA